MRPSTFPIALLSVLFAACAEDTRGNPYGTSGSDGSMSTDAGEAEGGGSGPDSGPSEEGGDTDGGSDDGADEGGDDSGLPKLDTPGGNDTGAQCAEGDDCGCTFVDILFVIDNSGSMLQHQQNLAAVFPEFIDVIFDGLPTGTDLHVGITTQGGFWTGQGSGSWSQASPGCVTDASPYPGGFTPPDVAEKGGNGDQGRLYEHDGLRYFAANTSEDPAALQAWFSAAATLPQADSPQEDQVELISAAGAYAFHPANAAHNDGFLRDEGAVLLIYFLTDTADITPESADSLADIVRGAKSGCGGDACILTAGMINEGHFCYPDYPRLTEFMEGFGKPPAAVGVIETGDFPFTTPAGVEEHKAVLGDALADVIAQTCAEIPPVD